jgi:hypothetical protein
MAEPKTKMTEASVTKFVEGVADEQKRDDCFAVMKMMRKVSGAEPKMWGTSIVGFGTHRYVYATGRELDWPLIGFAPRKENITLYLTPGVGQDPLFKKLGKHKTSKGCLYIKSLSDVDTSVLEKIIKASLKKMKSS